MSAARNFCGVVVTYFPPAGLEDRLRQIAGHVDRLIIVDNSATPDIRLQLKVMAERLGAELICNAHNVGIATALNQGVAAAQASHADWVVFFDQDSAPFDHFRSESERVMDTYRGPEPLAIVGCNYFLADGLRPVYPTESPSGDNYLPTDHVITSGGLYDMRIVERLGPFRDDFFIDVVDIEYGWRAMSQGYAVCRTTAPLLRHALGAPTVHAAFGRRLWTTNHAPFRRYFMIRNSILLIREYGRRFPRLSLEVVRVELKRTALMLVLEEGRLEKAGAVARGLWHGLLKRTRYRPVPSGR